MRWLDIEIGCVDFLPLRCGYRVTQPLFRDFQLIAKVLQKCRIENLGSLKVIYTYCYISYHWLPSCTAYLKLLWEHTPSNQSLNPLHANHRRPFEEEGGGLVFDE